MFNILRNWIHRGRGWPALVCLLDQGVWTWEIEQASLSAQWSTSPVANQQYQWLANAHTGTNSWQGKSDMFQHFSSILCTVHVRNYGEGKINLRGGKINICIYMYTDSYALIIPRIGFWMKGVWRGLEHRGERSRERGLDCWPNQQLYSPGSLWTQPLPAPYHQSEMCKNECNVCVCVCMCIHKWERSTHIVKLAYPSSDGIYGKVYIDTTLQVLAGWITWPEVGGNVLLPQLTECFPLSAFKGRKQLCLGAAAGRIARWWSSSLTATPLTLWLEGG